MIKIFKTFLICLLITSFVLFPKSAHADTIYQPEHLAKYRIEKGVGIINIQGRIDADTAKQTDDAFALFAKSKVKYIIIHLHSLGGSVNEGMRVIDDMNAAKKHNIKVVTLVDHKEYCASMCTAIFASGASRIAAPDTLWIFHSPYVDLTDAEKNDPVMVLAAKLNTEKARHLLLQVYNSADPDFTRTVLTAVVNDDEGKQLILYGYEILDHTQGWINFAVVD